MKNLVFITKDDDQSDSARKPQRYISQRAACGFGFFRFCFDVQFEVEEETEGSATTPALPQDWPTIPESGCS